MKKMIKQVVHQKLKNLTPNALIAYGQEHQIYITKEQANDIVAYLKRTDLNPLEEEDRIKALKKLAQITDPQTAQKVNRIFQQMIKDNGLSHWF